MRGPGYLKKGSVYGSKRSRSPITHSSKSDLSGVVAKRSSRPRSAQKARRKKNNPNSRRSVTASITSSEESESSCSKSSDDSSDESSSESESKLSGPKDTKQDLAKKESIYK